jgi:hypothetical protein
VNLLAKFREWSEAWQSEARWILWIWGVCLLVLGAAGWKLMHGRSSAGTDFPPPSAAGKAGPEDSPRIFAALQAARAFPADPDVWLAAAALLDSARPERARALRRDAALLPRPATPDRPAAEVLDRTASLMAEGRVREALASLDRLAPPLAAETSVRARRATLLASLHEIDALRAELRAGAWGRVNADVLELAFCADLAGRRQNPALRHDLWKAGLRAGRDRTEDVPVLIRLGLCLGLEAETEDSLAAGIAQDPRRLALVREYAVWAHRQEGDGAWERALALWREVAPAEAQAYAKAAGRAGTP